MSTANMITFPCDVYPRYNYARRYVRPLVIRCQQLLNNIGINDTASVPNFKSVTFVIEDRSLLNDCKWIFPKGSEPLTRHNPNDLCISVFQFDEARARAIENEQHSVFILKDNEACVVSSVNAQCVTQQDFPVFIGRLLERHVFRWLCARVGVLGVLRTALRSMDKDGLPEDKTSEYNRNLYKTLKALKNSKKHSTDIVDKSASMATDHRLLYREFFSTGAYPKSSPVYLIKENDHIIEELVAETMAMFVRNDIPSDETPDIDYSPTSLNDRMYEEICSLIPNVKGCGMRYGTLCIELDSSNNEMLLKTNMKEVLDMLKEKYQIRYIELREDVHDTYLAGRYRVGIPIATDYGCGTLGGFAMVGSKTIALLAKHVAGNGSTLFNVTENKEKIKIGDMLKSVANPKVDIAAAFLTVPVNDPKFKDLSGQSKCSQLLDLQTESIVNLNGLPVYIRGARSQPGHGKITMVKHVYDNMKMIEIEDYDDEAKFAVEGDSGAVICAEDPDGNVVTAIGMLMGIRQIASHNYKVAQRKKYSGFFLQDGIKQLQQGENETISLC